MKRPSQPGITVILEDAYKQNTVYRPWAEIRSADPDDDTPTREPDDGAAASRPALAERMNAAGIKAL